MDDSIGASYPPVEKKCGFVNVLYGAPDRLDLPALKCGANFLNNFLPVGPTFPNFSFFARAFFLLRKSMHDWIYFLPPTLRRQRKKLNRRPSPQSSKQSERLSSQIVVVESFSFSFLRDCPASDDSQDVNIVVAPSIIEWQAFAGNGARHALRIHTFFRPGCRPLCD